MPGTVGRAIGPAGAERDPESESATTFESVMSLADEFDYEVIGDTLDLRKPRVSCDNPDLRKPWASCGAIDNWRPKASTNDAAGGAKIGRATPDDRPLESFLDRRPKAADQKNTPRTPRHAAKDFPKHVSAAAAVAENVDRSDHAGEKNVNHVEKCGAGPVASQTLSDEVKPEVQALAIGNRTDKTEAESVPPENGRGPRDKQSSVGGRLFAGCRRWKYATPLTCLTAIRDGAACLPGFTLPIPTPLALYATHFALVPILGILLLLGAQMYRWAAVAPPATEVVSLVGRDEFVPITVIAISAQRAVRENEQPKAFPVAQIDDAARPAHWTSYADGLREAAQINFRHIWTSLGAGESQWLREVLRYLAPLSGAGRDAGDKALAWAAETGNVARRWTRESTETARVYYEAVKEVAGRIGGWSEQRERGGSPVACGPGNYFGSDQLSQALWDAAAATIRRAECWTRSAARATRDYYEGCRDAYGLFAGRRDHTDWAFAVWGEIASYFRAKSEMFANLPSALYRHSERIWFAAAKPVVNWASQVASDLEKAKQTLQKWRGWDRITLNVSSLAGKWNIGKTVSRDSKAVHVENDVGNREGARPVLARYTRWMEAPIATILSDLSRRSAAQQVARGTSYRVREFADGALARVHLGKEWMRRVWAQTFGATETSLSGPGRPARRREHAGEGKGPFARTRRESGKGLGPENPEHRSRRAAFADGVQAAFAAIVGGLF